MNQRDFKIGRILPTEDKKQQQKDRLYISEYKLFTTGGNAASVMGNVLVQCLYYECLTWIRTFIPGGPSSPAGPFSPGSP